MQFEVAVPLGVERDVRGGRAGLLQVVSEVGSDEADRGCGVDQSPADLVEMAHVVDEHVLLEVGEQLLDVHGLDGRGDRHVQRLESAVSVRTHRRVARLRLRDDDDRLRRLSDLHGGAGDDAGRGPDLSANHDWLAGVTVRRRKWDDLRAVVYAVLQ